MGTLRNYVVKDVVLQLRPLLSEKQLLFFVVAGVELKDLQARLKSNPHPERPDRLRAIAASLSAAGIFPGRSFPFPAREITQEELLMVHSLENIEVVESTSGVHSRRERNLLLFADLVGKHHDDIVLEKYLVYM